MQVVRKPNAVHQTRQNTQINVTQGTAEEQFAAIAATARNEALDAIEDLLTDDESVDYSTPATQTQTQVQIHQARPQLSDSEDTNHGSSGPDSATDSSLDLPASKLYNPSRKVLKYEYPKAHHKGHRQCHHRHHKVREQTL